MHPVKTTQGTFGVALDTNQAITSLRFPLNFNNADFSKSKNGLAVVPQIEKQLNRYFSGKPFSFNTAVAPKGTPFQKKVWKALQTIPFGQTRTYTWVARKIGAPKAARAVGSACGKNPVPIWIPCHRVVSASGGLGGFSSGLKWKRFLLNLEKADICVKMKLEGEHEI